MKILSKTDLLRSLDCPTRLQLDKQVNPDKERLIDENLHSNNLHHYRTQGGYEVEAIAESLFQGIQTSTLHGVKGLLETQSLVFAKVPAIAQASAQRNGNYARCDVLARIPNSEINPELRQYLRDHFTSTYGAFHSLNEVKSSTKITPKHILDLAFQTHVFESSGYKIGQTNLITVNPNYIRESQEIIPNQFLQITDVTPEVLEVLPLIPQMIEDGHNILNQTSVVRSTIYKQCHHKEIDKICPHIQNCPNWQALDPNKTPIFFLPFLTEKKQDQYAEQDVFYIQDIDLADPKITKIQKPIIAAHKQDQPFIQLDKIQEFLDQIDPQLPISFIDFETFSRAIPNIGHKPYQNIPVQFSSGVLYPSSHIHRHEFIETQMPSDSRHFAESLISNIEATGSVFAWFAQFEKSVIANLAEQHPDLAPELLNINHRMLDLREPFFRGFYVDQGFEGTSKLKKVAEVLVPELSYSDLAVNNGSLVGSLWQEMIVTDDENRRLNIMTDLQKYCSMDTTSLIRIYFFLKNLK